MTLTIEKIPRPDLAEVIAQRVYPDMTVEDVVRFDRVLRGSTVVWQATADDTVLAIWGIMPPTLMDQVAYLWLRIVGSVEGYEFLIVRHSQRAIRAAQEEYPTLVGHCLRRDLRAQRWVKWLGGTFSHPEGELLPFIIRKAIDG